MIELRGVSQVYPGGRAALRSVSLRVERGTTMALLGPSGSGKTTLLRVINRLVAPTGGSVLVNGRDVREVDPVALRREIGYVVQEAALFPHLTAFANVEVVPRLLGWSRERRTARARELFALMGLEWDHVAHAYPSQLSGGQRQRVGLARALAADPAIVLMDEPFAALDPLNRRRQQDEFLALKARLKKTVVLVTHDVDEAFRLADRVAVMAGGELVQVGSPAAIRAAPASPFVAAFLGGEAVAEPENGSQTGHA
jgi:osmoprotectant transport system ATP-binding protein